MTPIKQTLAELDDIFQWLFGQGGDFPDLSKKPHYAFRTELRTKYETTIPALRSYIEKLEQRIAYLEAHPQGIGDGDVARAVRLAEAVEKFGPDNQGRVYGELPKHEVAFWFALRRQRDAALSAYHSATRDITSKE